VSDLEGDVLVIGAGPAGIASAYYLEKAGIPYTVVDRAQVVGSTWASLYPSLRLNTASFVSHLPGERLPLRYGIYASGQQFYEYFQRYVEKRNFHILLRVEVQSVAPQRDGWCVETSAGSAWFPAVIVASGRFGKPYTPEILGIDAAACDVLHAHDFHHAESFAGQRLMVVGNGPSGVDIALELVPVAVHPVLLSIRSDIVISRYYPFGLPDSVWHMLARLFVPKHWRKRVLDKIVFQGYRDADQIGLPLAPNRTDRKGTSAPIRGRDLIDSVKVGSVKVVPGLTRFDEAAVELTDGSRYELDSVILSTGYRPAIGYLDIQYEPDVDGWPRRTTDDIEGGSTEVLGYPGLYLVGRFYRGLGPLHNIRNEARTAVQEIQKRLEQAEQKKL
jgi:cation diffusion facilitator CzcD-associated flavoprotein CzcO